MDDRVKKWFQICDFLADEDIPFLECEDSIYRPDFREYCGNVDSKVEVMNGRYLDAWENYLNFIKEWISKNRRK